LPGKRRGAALVRDVHHVKLARAMRKSSPEGRENSAGCNHWIGLREIATGNPWVFTINWVSGEHFPIQFYDVKHDSAFPYRFHGHAINFAVCTVY
jgi:hypothetical protein